MIRPRILAVVGVVALFARPAQAATGATSGVNTTAIALFLAFVLLTLWITWQAARRTKTASDFYAAGGNVTGFQNGLAIAGDAMSAGAFLGLTALVFTSGFDGLIYAIGYTTGMPIVVFLLAERLRQLGRYTFTDVVCTRLAEGPVRVFAACASLVVVAFYLIAQMVGAGQLIQLLFGLDYLYAEFVVGILMVCYVMFGGMVATTWVQVIKAGLLLAGATLIVVLVLATVGFDFGTLLAQASAAHPKGAAILAPQASAKDPLSAISLGLALMLGTAGLPHILMRFFTVPDARAARFSVLWAAVFMNFFYALVFVLGFGALALTAGNPDYVDATGALRGGSNMAAIHLSHAVGGNAMMGFISAVAFACGQSRPLRRRDQARGARRAQRSPHLAHRHLRPRFGGDRARDHLQAAERRLYGEFGFRHRLLVHVPGAVALALLARPHHDVCSHRRHGRLSQRAGPHRARARGLGEGTRARRAGLLDGSSDPRDPAARLRDLLARLSPRSHAAGRTGPSPHRDATAAFGLNPTPSDAQPGQSSSGSGERDRAMVTYRMLVRSDRATSIEQTVRDVVARIGGEPRSATVPSEIVSSQRKPHPTDHVRTTIGSAGDPTWQQLDLSFVDLQSDIADDIWSSFVVPRTLWWIPAADITFVGEVHETTL